MRCGLWGRLVAMVGLVVWGQVPAWGRQQAQPPPLVPFVLPWDDATPGVANMSHLIEKPAGKHGPIRVVDGHFHAGADRIRFLGVNLCFGANFPTHEEAEKIAGRMAKFGINCVRFHHMDTSASPQGLVKGDRKTIDPERLERLDYLIFRLKEHGIYSNLNLHVGRRYPDLPNWEGAPNYFKGIDNVDSRMIRSQMEYARALLHHVNPYTKSRYADEPAVAIVEINNENGLWNEWAGGGLDEMIDPYAADLQARWNRFLTERHATDPALKLAWKVREEPLGRQMLENPVFAQQLSAWNLEQHTGRAEAVGVVEPAATFLRVKVSEPAEQSWHIQLNQAGLAVKVDSAYTLRFRARADADLELAVNTMMAHDPWRQLWSSSAKVGKEWRSFEFVFRPTAGDSNARITFSGLGAKPCTFELTDVSLAPGGVMGLKAGESLGQVGWFRKAEFGSRTPEAQADWIRFLWSLEDRYWSGMYRILKQELGVGAVVLGTQMSWSPAPIQAKLDAIDSHSYWQHPHFPRRPWDAGDWTIENIPMAGRPDGGTLPRLGLSRVVGKPFLCTEYNHSAPNTYGSEGFLLLAAYAARQDWDGIFAFAYSHRSDGDWDARKITSFFDIDQHPTKMVTLPAAAAMFLRGDLPRASTSVVARPNGEQWVEAARLHGPWNLGASAFGTSQAAALKSFVGVALDESSAAAAGAGSPAPSDEAAFRWNLATAERPGSVTIDTPRTKAVIGSTLGGPFALGDVTVIPGPNLQDWAAITLTAIDGPDFKSSGRVLVTATGLAENQGMRWSDEKKTTVGRAWGEAPSMVEVVPAAIELDMPASRVKAWALDEKGQRRPEPLVVKPSGTKARIEIGPGARTLWYELEINASGR